MEGFEGPMEPISMGAGILPRNEVETRSDGELMYMTAKFERIVRSTEVFFFFLFFFENIFFLNFF